MREKKSVVRAVRTWGAQVKARQPLVSRGKAHGSKGVR